MKRRDVLGALAASVTLAGPAAAQRLPRVGVLVSGDPEPTWTLFRNAMADLGLVAGKTVIYEYRAADSASGKLGSYARELVARKVDVIVAVLSPATAAARAATSTIPIVVTNVARPEGNITGAFGPSSTLAGKGVQLLHGIVPGMKAVGLLLNANDPFHVPLLRDVEPVVHAEKLDMVVLPVRSGDEVAAAFDTMAARGLTREQVINDVLLTAQPTKQFVTVDEIAALAVYLAGDMARSITGAIISIDGGWTAA